MALTLLESDFPYPEDRTRPKGIIDSIGMDDVTGNIGLPFTLDQDWPPLIARRGVDCFDRTLCTGCDRITRDAQGRVYTLIRPHGDAFGAVCSSSIPDIPYFPIFFSRTVEKS